MIFLVKRLLDIYQNNQCKVLPRGRKVVIFLQEDFYAWHEP